MALVELKRESSPSPSSSSTRQPKYDVFLSFRGEDTRTNFTDHLYVALKGKGIITFRDEEELKKGERISELFKAIEESQFAIIILSRNYASSTWCLDELAKIIKCEDEIGLEVLPVFYNVSPSIVRKQTETFEQAFIDYQKRFEDNIEKVETWRDTLKKVADIKGWDLHLQNRLESEIIQDIVKLIMEKLSSKSSSIDKNLIGIKSMVAELVPPYLGFGNDIYMMGICGMGGLGKTTLANAIYYKYSDHFEGSSFIANVRERSEKGELHELQQQLLDEILEGSNTKIYNVQVGVEKIKKSRLRHKKVLLVLDDVNHKDQLEKLAGEHDWFGLGSWIIITTRDKHVLIDHGVLKIYKPNGLDNDDASKLFCLKAFKKEQPKEGYMQLSQKVVEYASGLPLALVTLGSFLVGRTVKEWQCALGSFKNIKGDIHDILKISYNGLEEMWKEIFLDIACFFRERYKDEVIQILENCGFDARIGISVLVEKSLLTVDGNEYLGMHDLLAEMGQKIIRFESGGKLGKQSRLWLVEDLLHILENDMATDSIQAIVVKGRKEDFNLEEFSEGFSKMSNLRLLISDRMNALNDRRHLALPNNLRYLRWKYCPFKCLASSHKRMAFVQLDLQYGKFDYLWEGVMLSAKLKFIDLSHSENLIKTPDFSGVPILEELNLSYCSRLVEIHPSILHLSRLRYLNLQHCKSLRDLPSMSVEMQSLKLLNLSYCSKIGSFPKFTGIMKSLSELILRGTDIKKVAPSSIECLTALTLLDLSFCFNLECLPSNMDNLRSLETLNLSWCGQLVEIHPSIGQLSKLRCLDLRYCESLTDLPSMFAEMQSLMVLDLDGCSKLNSFPKFTEVMKSLSELYLGGTAIKKVAPSSFDCLTALTLLDLSECGNLECLPRMDNLKSLEALDLSGSSKLKSLQRLPSTVRYKNIEGCSSLKPSPALVKLSIWPQPLSQWLPYDHESGSQMASTILLYFLQVQGLLCCKTVYGTSSKGEEDGSITEFLIIMPSCSTKIVGNSISIELPSNWYNSKWIGLALYASLSVPDVGWKDGIRAHVIAHSDMPQNQCASELVTTTMCCGDSICLLYLSRDDWCAKVGNGECSQIKVIIETDKGTIDVWECGFSLIYKQDVDEFNQKNAQCLIESFGKGFIYKLTVSDDDDVNIGGIYNSIETVETWRPTLREVVSTSGWHLHQRNRHKSEFTQQIVENIMEKLSPEFSGITKNILGIESIMAELIPSYLDVGNNVYMIGIFGMGGLGKTTLARAIYHRYSKFFEGSSFIHSVRERSEPSLLELQQQLLENILGESHKKIWDVNEGADIIKRRLSQKKVLIVLDDVSHMDQLEKLAGEHDWFGLGSWIIITTRDEHLLVYHGVLKIYKPNGLNNDDALKLFCLKAFKKEQPKESYMELAKKFVKYACGLPLILVTLGSFFNRRTIVEWISVLNSLQKVRGKYFDILKISYDGLEEMWKEIFLDIACFFRQWKKNQVIHILENCGFNARIGISVLVKKSLLTVDDNGYLGMHDLLAEMGQEIVRFESGGELGKQSRLWHFEDLLYVLENDMATEAIQAIVVHYRKEDSNFEEFPEVLSKMSNLRLMIIDKTDYLYDQGHLVVPNDQRQLFVPNQLRHLSWNCCPLKCLSSSSQPKKLVQLDLQCSRIEYLWEGVMLSAKLKFIDLSDSRNLIRTPDFSGVPILEEINLSGCVSLVKIHPSIGQLNRLRYLDLRYCESLTDLPSMSAEMQSLAVLNLDGCSKLNSFPKFTGTMKSLSELYLDETAIKKVAPSLI
ncbi:disease resistance protein RUN1-like [Quercus robur]|uniref:disease resistance protein RUN1-like n=1 Tax=Quercus robur TaxID=38942 RepID=UPI0021614321|nr:disease resistance protein RUN1-like [Quercus robur]